jgi:ketosteroid isomerase-like protein
MQPQLRSVTGRTAFGDGRDPIRSPNRLSRAREYQGGTAMNLTRRNLARASAATIGAVSLLRGAAAFADASDEAAVKQNVEALRKALLAADKTQLEGLASDQLSYGHSSGKVQNKAQFIDGVVNRKAVVKSLTFPDLTVAVSGDAAIARHLYAAESESDGKTNNVRIGVLAVWQKQDGGWKLLARQGYKLGA